MASLQDLPIEGQHLSLRAIMTADAGLLEVMAAFAAGLALPQALPLP